MATTQKLSDLPKGTKFAVETGVAGPRGVSNQQGDDVRFEPARTAGEALDRVIEHRLKGAGGREATPGHRYAIALELDEATHSVSVVDERAKLMPHWQPRVFASWTPGPETARTFDSMESAEAAAERVAQEPWNRDSNAPLVMPPRSIKGYRHDLPRRADAEE